MFGLDFIHSYFYHIFNDGVQKCQNTEFLKSRNVYLYAASRGHGHKTTATAIGNDLNEKCYDGFLHPDLQSFKILTIYYDF